MKTIVLTLIAAAIGFGQTTPSQTGAPAKQTVAPSKQTQRSQKAKSSAAQKPAAAQKAEPPVLAIPQGATLVEPNLYRQTDSSGKIWMYRQTPFGISKWEDTPAAPPPPPAAASEPVVVTDLGDSVRFEKKTAFGVSRWVRKKTELTGDEKALVAGSQADKPVPEQSEKKIAEKQ